MLGIGTAMVYRTLLAAISWGFGILWWLFWLAVFLLVVVLVRRLVRGSGTPPSHSSDDTALEILKERYARGEIDREEFEATMQDLGY